VKWDNEEDVGWGKELTTTALALKEVGIEGWPRAVEGSH
jgi:hypothetical protein